MLDLSDLKMKPLQSGLITDVVIQSSEVGKMFHYNSVTFSMKLHSEEYGVLSFFDSINLGDKYLANVVNLVLELFIDKSDSWEYLSLNNLKYEQCQAVIHGYEVLAIGRKGKWIYKQEVIELLRNNK